MNRRLFIVVTLLVAMMASVASAADGSNLLRDATDVSVWRLDRREANAASKAEEGAVRFDISKLSGTPAKSDVTWSHLGATSARAGKAYKLSFAAKASPSRQIVLCAMESGGSDAPLFRSGAIDVLENWQTYACTVTFPRDGTAATCFPQFQFGDKTGSIWFKDVTLVPADGGSGEDASRPVAGSSDPSPAGKVARVRNLIPNMENPKTWLYKEREGATGSIQQEGDSLRVDVTRTTTEAWHVLITHAGMTFPARTSLTLRFTAKASAATRISIIAKQGADPYAELCPTAHFPITTEWQDYTWKCDLAKPCGPGDSMPAIMLGSRTCTIWLKNMTLSRD